MCGYCDVLADVLLRKIRFSEDNYADARWTSAQIGDFTHIKAGTTNGRPQIIMYIAGAGFNRSVAVTVSSLGVELVEISFGIGTVLTAEVLVIFLDIVEVGVERSFLISFDEAACDV